MCLKCYSFLIVFPTTIIALMLSGPCPPERWSGVKVGALDYVQLYLLYQTFMTKYTDDQIPFFMDLSMTNDTHPLQLFATEEGSIDKTYLDPLKCHFRERLVPNAEHTSWAYEQIDHPDGSDCVSGFNHLMQTTTNWDDSGSVGVIYGCLDVNNGWQKDSHEVGIFIVLHRKDKTERASDMNVTMEMLYKIDPLLLPEMLNRIEFIQYPLEGADGMINCNTHLECRPKQIKNTLVIIILQMVAVIGIGLLVIYSFIN